MKKILLFIVIAFVVVGCGKSNRETLILGLWCSHDKIKSNSICLDFEGQHYPDNYELLITNIEGQDFYGQFKIIDNISPFS